ncbi:peptidase dimerization domain-containing protein, partial [Slackia piriformis]|uniref:peptidase dimerization domain-containing protein n=1 Tax=Slackia piriformis TaxID=626934 RepID=UPI0031E61437
MYQPKEKSYESTSFFAVKWWSKNKMKNAALIAARFQAMLPEGETPAHTEGYEGFYHLQKMEGDIAHARLSYIIRDHDRTCFEARKAF